MAKSAKQQLIDQGMTEKQIDVSIKLMHAFSPHEITQIEEVDGLLEEAIGVEPEVFAQLVLAMADAITQQDHMHATPDEIATAMTIGFLAGVRWER